MLMCKNNILYYKHIISQRLHIRNLSGPLFTEKLRHIVDFRLVGLYENTGPVYSTIAACNDREI